jgi:hypothetical protein
MVILIITTILEAEEGSGGSNVPVMEVNIFLRILNQILISLAIISLNHMVIPD